MEKCILVMDYNPEMLPRTHKAWAQRGYMQRCTKTGEEAVGELMTAPNSGREFQLIALVADYLDERLIPMVKLVRHISDLPLLILSSEYRSREKNESLALGADRYLPIPATIDEGIVTGLAMIRMSERHMGMHPENTIIAPPHDFYINEQERRVVFRGREIRLTRKEFDLLWYFAVNRNIMLSHERIYEEVWGDEHREDSSKTIRSTVSRLREKLGAGSESPVYIRSERYVGYRFEL